MVCRRCTMWTPFTPGIRPSDAAASHSARRLRRRARLAAPQILSHCAVACPDPARAGRYQPPHPLDERDRYMAGVKRIQEYIAAGDVYQLVLASRF